MSRTWCVPAPVTPPEGGTPPPGESTVAVFDCASGFSASGPCGVAFIYPQGQQFGVYGTTSGSAPALSGTMVNLMNAGAQHAALNMNYQSKVNVNAFSSTFTFIPNGWNLAFTLNNSDNNEYGFNGPAFSSGAGCEASFFQGFQPVPPNHVFAIELDSYSPLNLGAAFTYSSAQIYQTNNTPSGNVAPGQSPCIPNLGGSFEYVAVDKASTSPVNLTTGSALSTTGDVYSVTITYDGSALSLSMYDVTARGACPGNKCFTKTWTGVDIPRMVGGDTAYVGLATATNQSVPKALFVNSWSYFIPPP